MTSPSAITFSRGILKIPYLESFLGLGPVTKRSHLLTVLEKQAQDMVVIGWGLKQNTKLPKQYAEQNKLCYLSLEDGFLRSVGLGVEHSPPLSLVIDDLGIYYDATRPSRLEHILNNKWNKLPRLPAFSDLLNYLNCSLDPLDDEKLLKKARHCIRKIIDNQLSKYNSCPDIRLIPSNKPRILIVDQTAGDLSIQHGMANAECFRTMFNAALDEHPEADILVKMHPDVIAGKKRSHLAWTAKHPRVHLLTENCNPISLLQQVDHVYVVTSQLGFEALLLGKPVTCFGAPFYAGWGLTDDRIAILRRTLLRSIEQLFAAAYLLYARYRDPETGEACDIERVIDHLALQRYYYNQNSGCLYCYGFTPWKRGYIRKYLQSPWNQVKFVECAWQIKRRLPQQNARIVVWGRSENQKIREFANDYAMPIWRMEDGFLRSVGLGSDFTAPGSLVVDKQGIYFDPNQPSELEAILESTEQSEVMLKRAEAIRNKIIGCRISKYNVGEHKPLMHHAKPGQRVILVPGQVEGDASIRLGCKDIRTNESLLRAVRVNAPDAYILYKPHPDVLSGNRQGSMNVMDSLLFDQLVTDISIAHCLDVVDEVHTMTSLVGFEGLLRGKRVATYGLPFYAGWGLTEDRHKLARRKRTLRLDELVAGCMIDYPRYLNNECATFAAPESIISSLTKERAKSTKQIQISTSTTIRVSRKFTNLIRGLMYGI